MQCEQRGALGVSSEAVSGVRVRARARSRGCGGGGQAGSRGWEIGLDLLGLELALLLLLALPLAPGLSQPVAAQPPLFQVDPAQLVIHG